jgi:hypothetical protein
VAKMNNSVGIALAPPGSEPVSWHTQNEHLLVAVCYCFQGISGCKALSGCTAHTDTVQALNCQPRAWALYPWQHLDAPGRPAFTHGNSCCNSCHKWKSSSCYKWKSKCTIGE